MGLLDLPAPIFGWLDAQLGAVAPATLRLAIWAIVAAAASMLLYRLLSPQRRIAQVEAATKRVKRALDRHDGDIASAMQLSKRMLVLALERLRLVSVPALTAAVPVVCLMAWLSTSYGYSLPGAGMDVEVRAQPATVRAVWLGEEFLTKPRVAAVDERGRLIDEVTVAAPVTTVHKREWWNILVGNPAGYINADSPIDRIELGLPKVEYLDFGPGWLRGWEAVFLTVMLLGSLGLKLGLRIR